VYVITPTPLRGGQAAARECAPIADFFFFPPPDGRIAPRSGLASKNFIDTGAGVIDADYRGPVKVLLFNHADADFEVAQDDRIAQLVLERIWTPEVIEVPELENSVRGAGGFGSTGTN
jgi:dUTP pyrophosphatase